MWLSSGRAGHNCGDDLVIFAQVETSPSHSIQSQCGQASTTNVTYNYSFTFGNFSNGATLNFQSNPAPYGPTCVPGVGGDGATVPSAIPAIGRNSSNGLESKNCRDYSAPAVDDWTSGSGFYVRPDPDTAPRRQPAYNPTGTARTDL